MNKKISNLIYFLLVGAIAFVPFSAWAGTIEPIQIYQGGGSTQEVLDLINKVVNWILAVAGGLALIILIWGGVKYILSTGDKERTESAKKTILYAIIGLIVISGSYFLVAVGSNILTN